MITRTTGMILALSLTILIIAGCSPKNTTPIPSPSPTPLPFLSGTFVYGDWSWEFKGDGTFFSSGPIGSETGTYSVTGDQVTITCQCCGAAKGTYTWAFADNALSFTAVDDACANRKNVVDGNAWLKQP